LATKSIPPRPAPRLYLATPPVDDPQALTASLPGLLAKADIAAVLVRLKPADQRGMISRIKALAPAIQNAGAALLVDGEVDLVARGGADGAHLTGIAALEEALPRLKPDRIAGVGGLTTRHDSMSAGELGADYVLFGEPDRDGGRPSPEAIAERLQWWAELFEPPCIGFAVSFAEVHDFVLAGADFVLVDDLIWADPRGAAAALAKAEKVLRQAHADSRAAAPAEPGSLSRS
jgi:thiamine-phosphate pyrophosphorylase